MTPQQKIKWAILNLATDMEELDRPPYPCENIDDLYDEFYEEYDDTLQDAESEIRQGDVETGLPCESSRHYEADAVAIILPDNSWVGWTYWYGGGKHGEPESINWQRDAYDLKCTEETKMVIVRKFSK